MNGDESDSRTIDLGLVILLMMRVCLVCEMIVRGVGMCIGVSEG